MKPYYSDPKNLEFQRFVRSTLSLPFVPLERLEEALNILKNLAQKLKTKKEKKFAKDFLKYIQTTWINSDTFPPKTWNFFKPDVKISTNNYAEGYNSRLSHKRKLGDHPNVYLFASVIKDELEEGADDALYSESGNTVKRSKPKKFVTVKKRKAKLMEDLHERNIKLIDYMDSIGGLNSNFDKRGKVAGNTANIFIYIFIRYRL